MNPLELAGRIALARLELDEGLLAVDDGEIDRCANCLRAAVVGIEAALAALHARSGGRPR